MSNEEPATRLLLPDMEAPPMLNYPRLRWRPALPNVIAILITEYK